MFFNKELLNYSGVDLYMLVASVTKMVQGVKEWQKFPYLKYETNICS